MPDETVEFAYRECLDWLYRQTRAGAPREPERMRELLSALSLSSPPRVAHVVGTNGKGTVTAMTAAAGTAAGLRSGRFLSPHVEDFCERIAVDGRPIDKEQVIDFCERVRSRSLGVAPAFFELCLAMALDHFATCGVSLAVMEAGVGARRDATAVLENVEAVAVTPIALDHLDTLGPTLGHIAADKAAALRRGAHAASAVQAPEVLAVLEDAAGRTGTRLHVDSHSDPLFTPPQGMPHEPDPVRGRNQRLAAAVSRLLGLSEEAVAAGLQAPPLPGRGERFNVEGTEVILDGAHDPAAAAALLERAGRPFVLLFGGLPRKQAEATLRVLEGGSTRTFVTAAGGEAIAVATTPARTVIESPGNALDVALVAAKHSGLLLIAGSLYLAGELRPLLRHRSSAGNAAGKPGAPS